MSLPVKVENGAELMLGTGSLELVRARVSHLVTQRTDLTPRDRERILTELNELIASERERRLCLARRQLEIETLEHRVACLRTKVQVACETRLQIASVEQDIARQRRETIHSNLDIAERILALRDKYKPPPPKRDEYVEELSRMRKKHLLSEEREATLLKSITERAMKRAAFVKNAQEQYPDLAEELIDYYDQQMFQNHSRR